MKKLLSISLVAVAAISALGYRNQVTPSAPSSLTMANIEALSSANESNWEFPDGLSQRYECGFVFESHWYGDDTCSYMVESCIGGGNGCNTRHCILHN